MWTSLGRRSSAFPLLSIALTKYRRNSFLCLDRIHSAMDINSDNFLMRKCSWTS